MTNFGDMMKGYIRFNILILFLFIGLATTSCGIDSIAYLSADDTPKYISDGFNALDFSAPSGPSILYIGLNIYYRIYDSEDDANTDKSLLESKQGSTSIPGSSIPYLENTLKYIRPARYSLKDNTTSMVIPTVPDSIITTDILSIKLISGKIYLDLDTSSLLDEIEEVPDTNDVFELLRNPGYGNPSGFDIPPQPGDHDYEEGEVEDLSYFIQFFASSYGFNLAGSSPDLYSNAVYLGRIVLDVDR